MNFHEYLFNIFQFWRHLVVWIAKKAIFVSSMMCFMKIVNTNRIRLISEIVNFHEFPILKFVKRNERPLEVRPRNCHFDTKVVILCPSASRYPAFGRRHTQNVIVLKKKTLKISYLANFFCKIGVFWCEITVMMTRLQGRNDSFEGTWRLRCALYPPIVLQNPFC